MENTVVENRNCLRGSTLSYILVATGRATRTSPDLICYRCFTLDYNNLDLPSYLLSMANKRKYADPTPDLSIYSKRSRFFNAGDDSPNGHSTAQPRVDPTYGQRGAFPGLGGEDGQNDLFYGPASDGLEYLRMVR